MGKRWSAEDDAYLAYWYGEVGITTDLMAMDLDRTLAAVRQRVRKLDIYPPADPALLPRGRARKHSEGGRSALQEPPHAE